MALYSANELRSKISHGKREMREFDPKVGKLYHLWIPKNALYYVKKHFNIHSVPVAKHCRIKAVTCINTDPDAAKRKCPICDYIQELWETWRKETDKKEKKKIQTTINSLSAEYIYVNAIDINDADLKFVALRLTKGLLENFVMATQDTPVENIIWQYKKMDKNGKIEYTFLESPNDPKAIELCKDYETLAARDFNDGGLVDLEAALAYDTTEKKYLELLTGEEQEDDDSDEEEAPKKPAATKAKAAAKPKVEIEDDDSLSLDDIDMDEEEKPKAKAAEKPKAAVKEEEDDLELSDDLGLDEEETKPETNKKADAKPSTKKAEAEVSLDDDDLSLDDLDIEDLDSEDSSTTIEVDAAFLNENKSNRAYVDQIIEALVKQKKLKKTDNYVENLKAAYAVMKKNNLKVTIDEIPF
jgi:hypothetical protein